MTFPNKNGAAAQQAANAQVNRSESGISTDARNGQAAATGKTTAATTSTTTGKKNSATQNVGGASTTPATAAINSHPSATD